MSKILILGAGRSRALRMTPPYVRDEISEIFTLDSNLDCKPDIYCDLNAYDWNLECIENNFKRSLMENNFTEIHAYEVLEHLGRQGYVASFFSTFDNIWRLLVPGGYLCATTPSRYSCWLWGDPGHTRSIQKEHLVFLSQKSYEQCGITTMSDYRNIWKRDFKIISSMDDRTTHSFILQAIK